LGHHCPYQQCQKAFTGLFSSSALKLLLLPGLGVMLLYNAGIHPFSIEVAAILLGVPTATVAVIMSSEMEGDVKFASTAVTLSYPFISFLSESLELSH